MHIGPFELVAWSAPRDAKVGLVVGGSVYQVREWLMPALPEPAASATHHLVACNLGTRGALHPVDTFASVPNFRHYVIGAPLPGRSRASVDPVSGSFSLRAVCLRMGFGVVETQCAGDCGIDALCHHQGLPRNAGQFKRVRCELAAFMKDHAEDAAWQECFCACGESRMNPASRQAGQQVRHPRGRCFRASRPVQHQQVRRRRQRLRASRHQSSPRGPNLRSGSRNLTT